MIKFIVAFIVALCVTAPVKAAEPTWNEIRNLEIVFQTLNVIDGIQTIDCLDRNVCVEMNPIFGRNPSTEKVVGLKVAGGIIHYVIMREIYRRDPRAARVFQYISIGIQGGVVAANMRFTF